MLAIACLSPIFAVGQAMSGTRAASGTPAQLRRQQIETAARAGKISELEAGLMTVLSGTYETPQARQEAIRSWLRENGRAYDAEREAERARLQPQRSAQMAAMREQRKQRINEMRDSGRIGPKEAEFMTLLHGKSETPKARQEALKAWNESNAAAFAAEREQKRAGNEPLRKAQAEAMRDSRRKQIAKSVAAGRIGPVEGRLQALLAGDYPNPQERQQAVRAWMAENHGALENEKAARRANDIR
jgi:hypothetical protein